MLESVKHVVLVLSGKGGVGKSTVSSQLALTLASRGYRVGLLDVDLCGPSIPYIFDIEKRRVHQTAEGWLPVYVDGCENLAVMSIGFLLDSRDDAVIWRGPKKTSIVSAFINDVHWKELDYLIVDTPPGTSDEHISLMENFKTVKCDGAILVTTPQQVAIEDVRKELTFCRKTNVRVLGIVENMSGYVCPNCSECTNIFSSGGGESLARLSKVPFLGKLPIDPRVSRLAGTGKCVLDQLPDSETAKTFLSIADKLTTENSAV